MGVRERVAVELGREREAAVRAIGRVVARRIRALRILAGGAVSLIWREGRAFADEVAISVGPGRKRRRVVVESGVVGRAGAGVLVRRPVDAEAGVPGARVGHL